MCKKLALIFLLVSSSVNADSYCHLEERKVDLNNIFVHGGRFVMPVTIKYATGYCSQSTSYIYDGYEQYNSVMESVVGSRYVCVPQKFEPVSVMYRDMEGHTLRSDGFLSSPTAAKCLRVVN